MLTAVCNIFDQFMTNVFEDSWEIEKKRQKKGRQADKKGSMVKTVVVPESGSNSETTCEKCFRTSQFCEEAKENYRLEKVMTKALRKEIAEGKKRESAKEDKNNEIKKKNSQLKDENQLLKEKLAALEAFLKDSNMEEKPHCSSRTAKYNELQRIQESIPRLQRQATEKAQRLMDLAKDGANQQMARNELQKILEEFKSYHVTIQKKLDWIQTNQNRPISQLLPLRDAPKFSDDFETIYNSVVNGELEEDECSICLDSMKIRKDTVKCTGCKRRYHKECAWEWSTKGKDQCPTCTKRLNID